MQPSTNHLLTPFMFDFHFFIISFNKMLNYIFRWCDNEKTLKDINTELNINVKFFHYVNNQLKSVLNEPCFLQLYDYQLDEYNKFKFKKIQYDLMNPLEIVKVEKKKKKIKKNYNESILMSITYDDLERSYIIEEFEKD